MEILTTPNPILTQPSLPVAMVDKKVLEFIEEMKKTLIAAQNPQGVGLAAPQVGRPWRIFLARPVIGSKVSKIQVFVNPEIVWKSKELTSGVPKRENKLEGCLSIRGIWGTVRRHKVVKLRYLSPNGKSHTKRFTGFLATIIQHEMDHLDGRLFSSRVLEQHGKFYKIIKDEGGKELLQELSIEI